jgi:hypothetical protein
MRLRSFAPDRANGRQKGCQSVEGTYGETYCQSVSMLGSTSCSTPKPGLDDETDHEASWPTSRLLERSNR